MYMHGNSNLPSPAVLASFQAVLVRRRASVLLASDGQNDLAILQSAALHASHASPLTLAHERMQLPGAIGIYIAWLFRSFCSQHSQLKS